MLVCRNINLPVTTQQVRLVLRLDQVRSNMWLLQSKWVKGKYVHLRKNLKFEKDPDASVAACSSA